MFEYLLAPNPKDTPNITVPHWATLRSWFLALLIFNSSFLIFACGLDIEDPTPPSPPVWVSKSLPEEWPERGIDADESEGINLEWNPNLEDNISFYLIFRAEYFEVNDSVGEFDFLSRIEMESSSNLEYIDVDATQRLKYFYRLQAEDLSDNRSAYSDSIGYTLLPQISANQMIPNGLSEVPSYNRRLTWYYANNIEMENYCITILTLEGDFLLRKILNPGNYVNGYETWFIPDSIILESNRVYKWRIDTGAKYYAGIESAGSESPWATFLYIAE
jgi:hypothetical protein